MLYVKMNSLCFKGYQVIWYGSYLVCCNSFSSDNLFYCNCLTENKSGVFTKLYHLFT